MTQQVKLYGIFRSGTNLLKLLAETAFDVEVLVNSGGYKHLPSPINWENGSYVSPSHKIVVCVKDPYASMVSLHQYVRSVNAAHFDCRLTWRKFLKGRFIIRVSHPSKPPALYFRSPIDYWNAFYFHFASFEHDVAFVKYEDVVEDVNAVLDDLGRFLGEPRNGEPSQLPELKLAKMGERLRADPLTDKAFDADWYRERRYMEKFNKAQLKLMANELDEELMRRLQYETVGRRRRTDLDGSSARH